MPIVLADSVKIPYCAHFHPSVSLFASSLRSHDLPPNKPDLSLHTLIHFLDRFVYRNARSSAAGPRGMSIMQPLAGGHGSHTLASARYTSRLQAPVNSEAFLRLKSNDVAADEAFFHDYFNRVGRANPLAQRDGVAKPHADSYAAEDEDGESEIWKALVKSRPDLEDDERSESDMGMGDLSPGSEDEPAHEDRKQNRGLEEHQPSDTEGDSGFDLDLNSEGESYLASDTDLPSDVDRTLGDELGFNLQLGATASTRKARSKKHPKLKHLPTFASADSYAAMLNGSGDDDDG